MSFCAFTFEVPLKRLFDPTFQSWMSKIVRASESLGKSNGKKWSPIGQLLSIKGLKLPRKNSLFLSEFFLTEQDFFGIGVSHSV